jgi:hypothetical protein
MKSTFENDGVVICGSKALSDGICQKGTGEGGTKHAQNLQSRSDLNQQKLFGALLVSAFFVRDYSME